jgi:uncharacterized protein
VAEPHGIDTGAIVTEILKHYALPVRGTHGVVHWARVLENGLRLAEGTGADRDVVVLFALFHDSRRINEGHDPGHGRRGAAMARALRDQFPSLPDDAFERLLEACRHHTEGDFSQNVTIQACWDADRLDLLRVGITPDPELLGSDTARGLCAWANERAENDFEPAFVRDLWGIQGD